jgi:hypothetical protein
MPNWNKPRWVLSAILAIAAYFSAALMLKYSYVGEKPEGAIMRLTRPFHKFEPSGFAFVAKVPALDDLSDSSENPMKSPLWLYEGRHPLGPAHSVHSDIVSLGQGRFSHWKVEGFIFSTSDNSNPTSTGRAYWIVQPR